MLYQYKFNDKTKMYDIIEKATKFILNSVQLKADAIKKCRFYTNGGGFTGWTPEFMTRKTPTV